MSTFYSKAEESYLAHYGIRGQKWGMRRYQNSDGSLTSEGRERYGSSGNKLTRENKKEIRREYKADNKKAFEIGKQATISARAADIARAKEARAQKRYDRKQTAKRKEKLETAKKLRKDWDKTAALNKKLAEEHCKELASKYGADHIKNIKYDRKGRINEKVHTGKDYAKAYGLSLLSGAASGALGSPISSVFVPANKQQMARSAYKFSKRAESSSAGLKLATDTTKLYRKRRTKKD